MRMKHVRDFSLRYDILRGKIKYAEAEAVGAAAVSMKGAKREGLLYLFSSRAQERTVKASLLVQFVLVAGFMLYQSVIKGGILLVGVLFVFLYYRHRCYKELGGVTGDTAGYFLTLCEGVLVVLLGIVG